MRVLLIGAYGFIGSAIARQLFRSGHEVVALGRSARLGRRLLPDLRWIEADLNRLPAAVDWHPILDGVEAVVNASGGLQDDARDRLATTQGQAIASLIEACEQAGIQRFVQVSGPGAHAGASTQFMRTKAMADARLAASSLSWAILRPGLVIGRNAYGGTQLIRMLAAMPIAVTVHGERLVQCVGLDDVVAVTLDAVGGRLATGVDICLVERTPRPLREIVAAHRRWLGIRPASRAIDLHPALGAIVAKIADTLGWLGWRSPLRSTALRVVAEDIVADGAPASVATGREFARLDDVLADMPSGLQDRWHARLALLMPLIIGSLAALWIGSGVTGFTATDKAADVLVFSASHPGAAHGLVIGLAVLDIVLGVAILVRRWARIAAGAMAVVGLAYVAGATLLAAQLWGDPLAPLLKVIPAIVLALIALAILDER